MGAGATIGPAEKTMDDPTTHHHDVEQPFNQTAQALEHFLAEQAQAGVSELVLVGLLRGVRRRDRSPRLHPTVVGSQ
jgi:hypothetical protein